MRRAPLLGLALLLALALALPGLAATRDTEEILLAKADVVVLGEFVSDPVRKAPREGVAHYQADFRIAQVIKWDAPGEVKAGAAIKVHVVRSEKEAEDRLPELKKGGKCLLLLVCHDRKPAVPSYITADEWLGVQRASPALAKS